MFKISNKEVKEMKNKYELIKEWNNSKDYKRLYHLQTLIIKTYESVNIKAELEDPRRRIDENFTRDDYLEDFKVFFNPEIFNKLKDWCKEYEMLCEKENQLFNNL